jgi:leucyl-tRNA synthetase
MSYNTAVARMMEFMNLYSNSPAKSSPSARQAMHQFTQLLAPFAPFIAEELWEAFGHTDSIFNSAWPDYDADAVIEDTVTVIVQVNGKLRGKLDTAKDAPKDDVISQARNIEVVKSYLEAEPRKVIFVPNKLVNFVV